MTALPRAMDQAMAAVFGDAWLRDPAERLTYGYDNSRRQALPDAVALPRSSDQVVALVRA